ncbi:hypothetical protein [Haloarchaeobius sp. DFWS5]|uniref:hypothetical protein n=1 Tax=Haloarchaeobius sp. DFWS5 TaxID=3446114 RepID=UPI003EBFBEB4
MRKFALLALVALVCLSGCAGVIGDDSTSAPTEVDPADADLPPGVTQSGLDDPTALVAAHEETLNSDGFVLRGYFERNISDAGYRNTTIHATVGPGGEPFEVETQQTLSRSGKQNETATQHVSSHIWGNASTILQQVTVGDATKTGQKQRLSPARSPTRAPQYETYLTVGNPNLTVEKVVERDGHTFTTLVTDETIEADNGVTVNLSTRFVVDERGIVHEAVIDTEADGVSDHHEYRIVELGPDTPDAPTWTDNVSESGTTTASLLSAVKTPNDFSRSAVRATVAR